MLKILHGDNIAASRNAFSTLKHGTQHTLSLRGGSFTLTDLAQIFEGGDLFGQGKSIFIEDFFAKVKGEELKTYADYLATHAEANMIVLWEGKVLTKTQLNLLKIADVQLFKLPTLLFNLLDSLKPNNTPLLISLAQKVMVDVGEEILFSMITRHIRMLLALREEAGIEEIKRLAPWQKTKLLQQSASFTTAQLVALHRRLFIIDSTRKVGTNSLPLPASIDFFLLRI